MRFYPQQKNLNGIGPSCTRRREVVFAAIAAVPAAQNHSRRDAEGQVDYSNPILILVTIICLITGGWRGQG
jgi:hypothetical protein